MKDEIEKILNKIRPALILDQGNVVLRKIDNYDVYLELVGSCMKCSSLPMTFHFGIASEIRKALPEIDRIILLPSGLTNCKK